MNKLNFKYVLLCFVCIVFLTIVFVLVNTSVINTKELDKKIDNVTKERKTTTTVNIYETYDILVDNISTTINVDTYNSILGFSIKYDVDNLNVSSQSDSTVIFSSKDNSSNYLKIFKLNEDTYKSEYESNLNGNYKSSEEIDGNTYEYSFYRIDNSYFKVMKSIHNSDVNYNKYKATFEYMISTLASY